MSVAAVATLHDPEARLASFISTNSQALLDLFPATFVVLSPATCQEIKESLLRSGFKVTAGFKSIPKNYKKALKLGVKSECDYIFYADYDRLLHWAAKYPEELRCISERAVNYEFALIGRTKRAFQTHPETQRVTEHIANLTASRAINARKTLDVISACWGFSRRIAKHLLKLKIKNTYGFFCEWPVIAWRKAKRKCYFEVEGLEWETPDRYAKEIASAGYDAWVQSYQTREEWRRRAAIAQDCAEVLARLV